MVARCFSVFTIRWRRERWRRAAVVLPCTANRDTVYVDQVHIMRMRAGAWRFSD